MTEERNDLLKLPVPLLCEPFGAVISDCVQAICLGFEKQVY